VQGEFIGTVEVFRDVTHEHEIDRAKTEFVSLASHQLRTPLTAISWYTEMLLDPKLGKLSDDQQTFAEEIQNGSNRMTELVNALLNVSRIELGNFAVDPKPISIATVLDNVLKDIQTLVKESNIALELDLEEAPDSYKADSNLLSMIFQNLITNAIKYTDKGSVKVRVYQKSKKLQIEVSDTGLGIPEDQQKNIFKKMFRASNVKRTDTTGTGLGLYLVKAIVEEVNGTIRFESQENEGTTFFITMPLSGMKSRDGSKPLNG